MGGACPATGRGSLELAEFVPGEGDAASRAAVPRAGAALPRGGEPAEAPAGGDDLPATGAAGVAAGLTARVGGDGPGGGGPPGRPDRAGGGRAGVAGGEPRALNAPAGSFLL